MTSQWGQVKKQDGRSGDAQLRLRRVRDHFRGTIALDDSTLCACIARRMTLTGLFAAICRNVRSAKLGVDMMKHT